MRATPRIVPLLALTLLWASPSRAEDEDAAALQQGKALYDEATPLLDAKKFAEACPKLREATRLVPIAVGARLALGECEEGLGRLASALAAYRKAQALAAGAGQPDREKAAQAHAAAIESKVGSIALAIRPEDALLDRFEVLLDGRRLDAAERGAPILVDAGKHTIAASAQSGARFEATVEAKDGERTSVTVRLAAPSAPGPTAAASATGTASANPGTPAPSSPLRTVGLAFGIAGVAALGVGGGLGGLALSKNDESFAKGCEKGGQCTSEGAAARRAAYDAATVSTALFIGGGALLAAGAGLFLFAPRTASPSPSRTEVSLGLGPSGVVLQGRFQ